MSEKEDLALEILTDFFNAVEAGIAQARQRLKEAKVEPERKWTWDPSRIKWARALAGAEEKPKYDIEKIKWEKAQGAKGEFERSEDVNSQDFKELLKDVQAHGGKMTVAGYFVWAFKNGATLGRKPRKR